MAPKCKSRDAGGSEPPTRSPKVLPVSEKLNVQQNRGGTVHGFGQSLGSWNVPPQIRETPALIQLVLSLHCSDVNLLPCHQPPADTTASLWPHRLLRPLTIHSNSEGLPAHWSSGSDLCWPWGRAPVSGKPTPGNWDCVHRPLSVQV